MADKKECTGTEVYPKTPMVQNIEICAQSCKGISSMFLLGTNDFRTNRCDEIGCACICETAANPDGTCNMVDNKGYRLFKYQKGEMLDLHYKTKRTKLSSNF